MQEKERIASEEADNRLKAALAKREPNTTVSRVASPNPSPENAPNGDILDAKPVVSDSPSNDVVMEPAEKAASPEVRWKMLHWKTN